MAIADVQYRYLSLDSDHDLTATTLKVSIDDGATFPATADHVSAPAHAASLTAPAAGLTRYWWRVLLGPGQPLVPAAEVVNLVGELTDSPEILHPAWRIYV